MFLGQNFTTYPKIYGPFNVFTTVQTGLLLDSFDGRLVSFQVVFARLLIFVSIVDVENHLGQLSEAGQIFISLWWQCLLAVFSRTQDIEGAFERLFHQVRLSRQCFQLAPRRVRS